LLELELELLIPLCFFKIDIHLIQQSMKIQILCDNPDSWIIPYAKDFATELMAMQCNVKYIEKHNEVETGDILILLSCEQIFKRLDLNTYNLVVHESDLPRGKGWSPLTWQIVEGASQITVTLFEASTKVDDGSIYGQETIEFKGTELIDELRSLQAKATIKLLRQFVNNFPDVHSKPQTGESTFYRRRTKEDSKLSIDKSLADQFNILRISDNQRYPAWFEIDGQKFELHIFKAS
jgi:methionyl-tRNA formyltransferase